MNNSKIKRNTKSALEKLADLEKTKASLIQTRNKELLDIISKHGSLTIDDQTLIGFLMFVSNKDNKDHATLTQFKELASARKSPSKNKI